MRIGVTIKNLSNILKSSGPSGIFFDEAHDLIKDISISLIFLNPEHILIARFYCMLIH